MEYNTYLQQAGLTSHEAALYEVLVVEGALRASVAARLAKVPRTLAYKRLEDLIEKGFVEKEEHKGVADIYHAMHPQTLKERVSVSRLCGLLVRLIR